MKKILLGVIALLLMTTAAQAIRPKRGLIPHKQSDGTTIMVQKEGDRHLAFYVSEDGYVLTENAAGDLCYAEIQSNRICATNVVAHGINLRAKNENTFVLQKALRPGSDAVRKAMPAGRKSLQKAIHASTTDGLGQFMKSSAGATGTIGDYVIPVVMVQFKNLHFTKMTEAKLTRYLNEEGYHDEQGAVGSVRDYFLSQSRGIFNPRFEVVGTVTLSQNYSAYGGNDSNGNDKGFLDDYKFVAEAIDSATKKGVDFSKFARDGKVPNVSFFYAGRGEATEGTSDSAKNYIWPHMDDLNRKFNDVYFNSYFVGNEIYSDGSLMGMGVFCHEFGHVLGLPDFYCTDYSHSTSPIGDWSIMDYGAYVNDARAPMGYTAYERSYMGWLDIPELKTAQKVTLSSYDQEGTPAMLIRNPSDKKEYFIIENHQPGTWYPRSYGSGLLVMRIAYSQTAWDYNILNNTASKLRSMLVSANGTTLSGGNASTSAELWGNSTSKKDIKTWTLYNGSTISDKPILNITKNNDGTISFNFIKDKFNTLVVGDTLRKDGICYVKTAEEELTVVRDPQAPYAGEIVVPQGFYEDETDFTVVALGEGAFASQPELQKVSLPVTIREIAPDAFRHTPALQAIIVESGNRKFMTTPDGVLYNKNSYFVTPAMPLRAAAADVTTFDFASNPWKLPTSDNSDGKAGNITAPITVDNVTMTVTNGTTATRLWQASNGDVDLRVYKGGGTLTFATTDGSNITNIEFATTQFALTASEGTLDGKTWTGEAQSVTFTATSTNKITQVTLTTEASDVRPELICFPAGRSGSYEVPEPTEVIRDYAFEGASLWSLTLPSTLLTVGKFALAAPSLTSLTCGMTSLPAVDSDPFMGDTGYEGVDKENCQLNVPADAEQLYRNDAVWAPFFAQKPVDAIHTLTGTAADRASVFDLQGRRVMRATKGVYIIGGKKVIVK